MINLLENKKNKDRVLNFRPNLDVKLNRQVKDSNQFFKKSFLLLFIFFYIFKF